MMVTNTQLPVKPGVFLACVNLIVIALYEHDVMLRNTAGLKDNLGLLTLEKLYSFTPFQFHSSWNSFVLRFIKGIDLNHDNTYKASRLELIWGYVHHFSRYSGNRLIHHGKLFCTGYDREPRQPSRLKNIIKSTWQRLIRFEWVSVNSLLLRFAFVGYSAL